MNEQMIAAFNDQIALEHAAAYSYRQMSAWADVNDLSGMAQWFAQQAQEETDHAILFTQHLLDRGGEVVLQAIAAPKADFDDIIQVFEAALEQERAVTRSIGELYAAAQRQGDYTSVPMLTTFLQEQVEEEATVSTILGELRLAAGDPSALLMLDRDLAARRAAA